MSRGKTEKGNAKCLRAQAHNATQGRIVEPSQRGHEVSDGLCTDSLSLE